MLKRLLLFVGVIGLSLNLIAPVVSAHSGAEIVYVFGRDDCSFCKAELQFLHDNNLPYQYLNVVEDEKAAQLFHQIAEKHDLSKVTPLSVIGVEVIQGFNSPETTGERIKKALARAHDSDIRTLQDHIEKAPKQDVAVGSGCDEDGVECNSDEGAAYVFDLPFIGLVDLRTFSLFSLSAVLGTIDGFNPCAMWVLITFLVLLSQAGSRRKMVVLASIFILAEAIMYNLILNVWYKTWDFVALDQIVTPLVGFLALGGGAFFLYRWYKNRDLALVCDISDIESQSKTINKFKAVINQPLTVTTIVAIVTIAFSVNVIEFACSIGIPQAYTKILELNMLSFVERQFYILIYTFGYMLDDIVVFALAIWGYSRLEAHGHKYSQLSLLIGGFLMVVLGTILVIDPSLLVL